MKKLVSILAAVLLTATLWAQSPEKMSYQAVVRNSTDALVSNHAVGMQISIFQGTANGTLVYEEKHSSTTNANGLVSIEIGAGTDQVGDFSAIDWADGPYFIETKTDPTGGSTYTITGTSQLLSVPYALHAKTAENFTGTITEIDPVFAASVASSITASDSINLSNLSGVNTGDQDLSPYATKIELTDSAALLHLQLADSAALLRSEMPVAADGSETKVTGGLNIMVTGTGTTADEYVINTTDTLKIGDSYQGGIIFWVDETGRHGLIASNSDQSPDGGIQWSNKTAIVTGVKGDGIYAGSMNTALIIAAQIGQNTDGDFAAKVCADYVNPGTVSYGDWYLPSLKELELLYAARAVIRGLDSQAAYWSSTESPTKTESAAYLGYFYSGQFDYQEKEEKHNVRAIRAF